MRFLLPLSLPHAAIAWQAGERYKGSILLSCHSRFRKLGVYWRQSLGAGVGFSHRTRHRSLLRRLSERMGEKDRVGPWGI